jgi:hypothetical protein
LQCTAAIDSKKKRCNKLQTNSTKGICNKLQTNSTKGICKSSTGNAQAILYHPRQYDHGDKGKRRGASEHPFFGDGRICKVSGHRIIQLRRHLRDTESKSKFSMDPLIP